MRNGTNTNKGCYIRLFVIENRVTKGDKRAIKGDKRVTKGDKRATKG